MPADVCQAVEPPRIQLVSLFKVSLRLRLALDPIQAHPITHEIVRIPSIELHAPRIPAQRRVSRILVVLQSLPTLQPVAFPNRIRGVRIFAFRREGALIRAYLRVRTARQGFSLAQPKNLFAPSHRLVTEVPEANQQHD